MFWVFATITSNDAKMLPLKMGPRSLRAYCVSVRCCKHCYPTTTGKNVFYFFLWFYTPQREGFFCILQVSVFRCMDYYSTIIGKDFLLWIVARSPLMRQKILSLKMGIPSLGVAFIQERYSLVSDCYHKEYS